MKDFIVKRIVVSLYNESRDCHLRLRLVNLILFFCPVSTFSQIRTLLYKWCGFSIGRRSLIIGNMTCVGGGNIFARLRIGAGALLNSPVYLDLNAPITIGNDTFVGNHVRFVTSDHEIGLDKRRCGILVARPIVVEDGCWIGAGAMIGPGVTIGRGSVVSMGAVVMADVAANKVVGGNPARPIKTLSGLTTLDMAIANGVEAT